MIYWQVEENTLSISANVQLQPRDCGDKDRQSRLEILLRKFKRLDEIFLWRSQDYLSLT